MRRCIEVAVEMVHSFCLLLQDLLTDATVQPTPYTLLCVLGYMTTALLILDVRVLALLLPPALLGTCNLRLSTRKGTDVGDGPITPETPVKAANGEFPLSSSYAGTVSHSWIRVTP